MTSLAPKLADRYIFKQLLDYFLLGAVVFTLIFFFSDTLLHFIREIQKYGIPFGTMLTMIGLQLPRSVAWVLPASGFLAVLMVFNQLNNQFEIISMRMNGISLWRLAMPALLLGLLCSVMTYLLNDYVVPWCNVKTEEMRKELMHSSSLPVGGNSFMYRSYDKNHSMVQMIYVNHYQGRTLGDSTIIDLSKPRVMQVLQSHGGSWDPAEGWNLQNVNMYVVSRDVSHSFAGHFGDFKVQGLLNKDEQKVEKDREDLDRQKQGIACDADQQSFIEMQQCIQRREAGGHRLRRSNYLDMWQKITWPLGCLALILNAVPLALSPPRQGSNRGFIFAIVVLALFYQLLTTFQNIGRFKFFDFGGLLSMQGYLLLIAWLPFVIIAVIGILLMQRKSHVL